MLKTVVNKAVGDALVKGGLLDEETLQRYSQEAANAGVKLTVQLIRAGVLQAHDILKVLSASFI